MPMSLMLLPLLVCAQVAEQPIPTVVRCEGPASSSVCPEGAMNDRRRPWFLRTVEVASLLPERPEAGGPVGTVRRGPLQGAAPEQGGVSVPRRCGPGWCVDGLVDQASGRVILEPQRTRDEGASQGGPGGWLERAVKITTSDDRTVSAYIGSAWWSVGAAHRNTELACATWDRATGRRLTLADVMPPTEARALLRDIEALLADPNESIDRLGDTLVPDCVDCSPSRTGVLFERGPTGPEPVLCLETSTPGAGMGVVHELHVGALRRALASR